MTKRFKPKPSKDHGETSALPFAVGIQLRPWEEHPAVSHVDLPSPTLTILSRFMLFSSYVSVWSFKGISGNFAYMKLHEPCKGRLLLTGYMQQKEQFLNYSGAPANLQTLKSGVHPASCSNSLLLKRQGDGELGAPQSFSVHGCICEICVTDENEKDNEELGDCEST